MALDEGCAAVGFVSCAALRETVVATAPARAKTNRIRWNEFVGLIVLPLSNVDARQVSLILAPIHLTEHVSPLLLDIPKFCCAGLLARK